jgi:hypothetical protein
MSAGCSHLAAARTDRLAGTRLFGYDLELCALTKNQNSGFPVELVARQRINWVAIASHLAVWDRMTLSGTIRNTAVATHFSRDGLFLATTDHKQRHSLSAFSVGSIARSTAHLTTPPTSSLS